MAPQAMSSPKTSLRLWPASDSRASEFAKKPNAASTTTKPRFRETQSQKLHCCLERRANGRDRGKCGYGAYNDRIIITTSYRGQGPCRWAWVVACRISP